MTFLIKVHDCGVIGVDMGLDKHEHAHIAFMQEETGLVYDAAKKAFDLGPMHYNHLCSVKLNRPRLFDVIDSLEKAMAGNETSPVPAPVRCQRHNANSVLIERAWAYKDNKVLVMVGRADGSGGRVGEYLPNACSFLLDETSAISLLHLLKSILEGIKCHHAGCSWDDSHAIFERACVLEAL